ncbi:MAG: hypothetical protein RL571_1556 [Pseudomonadota bacterium]
MGQEVLSASKIKLLDQNCEIASGKLALENMIGHSINRFCYLGGKYVAKLIDAVKRAEFSYARTVKNSPFHLGHFVGLR